MAKDPIVAFLDSYAPAVAEIAKDLRALVQQIAPDATETLHPGWKVVSYGHADKFCAIAPHKNTVNLQFHQGASLDDPARLLTGTGKSMRHVKLGKPADARGRALRALVRVAAERAR